MDISVIYGITESFRNVHSIVIICGQTQNIWILLTNQGLVIEMAQCHNHRKVQEFCEMSKNTETLALSQAITSIHKVRLMSQPP